MKRSLNIVLMSSITGLFSVTALAQDPTVSSPTVTPAPALVGGPITLSVNFTNVSALPVNNIPGDPMYINFSLNKVKPVLNPNNTPVVTGTGAAYFTWSAACMGNCSDPDTTNDIWVVTGTQSQSVPGFTDITQPSPGGPIQISGKVIAGSTIAQSNAFNGSGFNANIEPGGGGDVQNGPGSNNQSGYTYTNGNALPVVLLDLDAQSRGKDIAITWSTAAEYNNDHFEVEHSSDGDHFNKVGTVKSNGGGVKAPYTFLHKDMVQLNSARMIFYRLRQVDKDGQFQYSRTAFVNLDHVAGTTTIFPNPARRGSFVNINTDRITKVQVYNISGARLWSQIYEGQTTAIIPTAGLSEGVYLIRINDSYSSRFTVY